jgi:hypothetical protein
MRVCGVASRRIARWTIVTFEVSSCQVTSTMSIGNCLPATRAVPTERVRNMPEFVSMRTVLAVVMICSRLAREAMRAAVLTASPNTSLSSTSVSP